MRQKEVEADARAGCHCAGCGAELPDTEAIMVDVLAGVRATLPDTAHGVARDDHIYYEELRCDLCWRAMLAAEAAQCREEHATALAPLVEELAALARARATIA